MNQKKKIVMISDHCLSTSGVGCQSRFLMHGLVQTGRYTFRQLGSAMKHQDYSLVKVSDDLLIKPIDGFGNQEMIRQLLYQEKPDALMLFTDPRFYQHIFAMHDEIHQVCPIIWNHLWDDSGSFPPHFNKPIYEICDLFNCINWPTYEFATNLVPQKTNYIPHAVPSDVYRPLSDSERKSWRMKVLGDKRKDHFVALFVGRNARRKRSSDIMVAWKIFIDDLKAKYDHTNATLVMHCNPHDPEGPNLIHVLDFLKLHDNVMFSNQMIDFDQMNGVYNSADVLVNASVNEGFGLPVLEAKMTELPVIAVMTGGLIRQVKDHETGYEYGVAMPPDLVTCVGNQGVPYIGEDFVTNETIARAFTKMFNMTKAEREEIGKNARIHALKNYSMENMIKNWDESLQKLFKEWTPDSVRGRRVVEL